MLIQRAVLLDGTAVDIRVGPKIVDVADRLVPRPGEDVYDAAGGTVLPGLHDHHLHIRAAAAAMTSVHVGPEVVRNIDDLRRLLTGAPVGADGWIRAVGYHDAGAGELDRGVLDAAGPSLPVRVQHRSGVLLAVNSAGLQRLGLAGHPDGRLRSADISWSAALPRTEPDLAQFSSRLCGYGVTGLTDATPDLGAADAAVMAEARQRGDLRQDVHLLSPGKRILHDDALDLDELTRWVGDRHAENVPVALHCVTAAQLIVALAALRSAGRHPADRVEHAAIVPDDTVAELAAAGVTVVTQPNFVAERGDQYVVDVPAAQHHELWRVATLTRAGIPVALSTDAPFGDADPWAAMRAAVHRRTPAGAVLGPHERVSPRAALTMFLGSAAAPLSPRRVCPDAPGDLCVLSEPPATVLGELDAGLVAVTVLAGKVVFDRG